MADSQSSCSLSSEMRPNSGVTPVLEGVGGGSLLVSHTHTHRTRTQEEGVLPTPQLKLLFMPYSHWGTIRDQREPRADSSVL